MRLRKPSSSHRVEEGEQTCKSRVFGPLLGLTTLDRFVRFWTLIARRGSCVNPVFGFALTAEGAVYFGIPSR